MVSLSREVKEIFYATIKGDISVVEFEDWLYANKEIAMSLLPEDHLELISLDYKQKHAHYELSRLLRRCIGAAEFETLRILDALNLARGKRDGQSAALMQLYDLYCEGYGFLRELALGYGLAVRAPAAGGSTANGWDQLSADQQRTILEGFSPGLEHEIDRVAAWLKSGEIVLTGEQDAKGRYTFQDRRAEEEKKVSQKPKP